MGGTSLLMNSIGFGVILGVTRFIQEEKNKQMAEGAYTTQTSTAPIQPNSNA
jgi:hypothetical protein